jgi:hypothetical protein
MAHRRGAEPTTCPPDGLLAVAAVRGARQGDHVEAGSAPRASLAASQSMGLQGGSRLMATHSPESWSSSQPRPRSVCSLSTNSAARAPGAPRRAPAHRPRGPATSADHVPLRVHEPPRGLGVLRAGSGVPAVPEDPGRADRPAAQAPAAAPTLSAVVKGQPRGDPTTRRRGLGAALGSSSVRPSPLTPARMAAAWLTRSA